MCVQAIGCNRTLKKSNSQQYNNNFVSNRIQAHSPQGEDKNEGKNVPYHFISLWQRFTVFETDVMHHIIMVCCQNVSKISKNVSSKPINETFSWNFRIDCNL